MYNNAILRVPFAFCLSELRQAEHHSFKNIMQYTSVNPSIPALNWGRKNEDWARVVYVNTMKDEHRNFSLAISGLFLPSEYPHLGATPDGSVSYDCYGEGRVEVKCLYKYKCSPVLHQ